MPTATRRAVLGAAAGLGAAALLPAQVWADAGGPAFLAAAGLSDGSFALLGLTAAGAEAFRLALPGRGHAAAAHPRRPEAVAFARRPGTFALVIDCAERRVPKRLTAPEGWHFGGHGAFSADGGLLFTTESGPEAEGGRVGVWDAAAGYHRLAALPSGGVGPHEILRLPDGEHLAVANGGILTDGSSGRAKLDLAAMRPNLALIDPGTGALTDVVEPPEARRRLSIRHLAAARDGTLALALQWEGDPLAAPPLLALLRPGAARLDFRAAPPTLQRRTRNYAGSVAITADGGAVALTAPRGGLMLVFDLAAPGDVTAVEAPDLCGVAVGAGGFTCTTGEGRVLAVGRGGVARAEPLRFADLAFDNHLVAI